MMTLIEKQPYCIPCAIEIDVLVPRYMHGNKLGSLAVLEKLGSMPNLEKATFNGNPFEKKKIYRMFSVGAMPQLRSLDHTSIFFFFLYL